MKWNPNRQRSMTAHDYIGTYLGYGTRHARILRRNMYKYSGGRYSGFFWNIDLLDEMSRN